MIRAISILLAFLVLTLLLLPFQLGGMALGLRLQRAPVAGEATVMAASRRSRTIELVRVLDTVSG